MKKIMKEIKEAQKLPYWHDGYLYFLKNLLLGQQAARKPVSNAFYLIPPKESYATVYMWLGNLSKQLDFTLKLKFHSDLYDKYDFSGSVYLSEFIKGNPDSEIAKLYGKILENDFTITDFAGKLMTTDFEKLAEWIEFGTDLESKIKRKIKDYLNNYLKLLMEDRLKAETQNYVRYQRMKESMMNVLFDLYNKYGNDFIADRNRFLDFWSVPWTTDNEYLFIHTLLALECEGLVKIGYFWVDDLDSNPKSKVVFIGDKGVKADLMLTNEFLKEVENADYIHSLDKPIRIKTPKQEQTIAPTLKFDPIKSFLLVGTKSVKIVNHSNQYELLRIVFEKPDKTFREWFYDEIIEDYDSTRMMKEKSFENAAYQLNNKIIRDTGLRDVIEVKKRSVIFNKKYESKT